jgi:hypothetical protein
MGRVLASPSNTVSTALTWSSTNPYSSDCLHTGLGRTESLGCASSDPGQSKRYGSSTKKRASRAGARCVSAMSDAQRERKRANDRKYKEMARRRTKDCIKDLEITISKLRRSQDISEKTTQSTWQRNRELEEENSFMRTQLNKAGLAVDLPLQRIRCGSTTKHHTTGKSLLSHPQDPTLVATHNLPQATHTSGEIYQRSGSTTTSCGSSGSHLDPSGLRPQQPQKKPSCESYSVLADLPSAVCRTTTSGSTTCRSHEGAQVVAPVAGDIHATIRNATCLSYNAPPHADRTQWLSTESQYHCIGTEQQPHAQYSGQVQPTQQHVATQQQIPYSQAPLDAYPPAQQTQQQYPAYHSPQTPLQSGLQNFSAYSGPLPYTTFAPEAQSFAPEPRHRVAPIQSNEYQQPQVNLPIQSMPALSYQLPSAEQGHTPQLFQQSQTQYSDDLGLAFPMAHYRPV